MKSKIQKEESWGKAPGLFAVLMAINVASYALCVPMMVKILEAKETSIFSILGMLIFTVCGMLLAGKLSARVNKLVAYACGALLSAAGIVLCALDAVDVLYIPGPTVMATATGDSLFFIATYIVSDVFSEVFGYKASRLSGNTSAIFAIVAALLAKGLTVVPVPEYAEANESAFDFIYGGGIYVTVVGILIYAVGDFLNDKLFAYIKKRKPGDGYANYSLRSIGSSILGKTADLGLFTVLVMIPFSIPSFCKAIGMDCWGMDSRSIAGNFLLGIAFQITVEALMSPVSYKIASKVKRRIEA